VTLGSFAAIALTNLGFVVAALPLGEWAVVLGEQLVAQVAGRQPPAVGPSLRRFGLALLVGLGVEGYVGVVLGLARIFHEGLLVAVAVTAVVLGRRSIGRYGRWAVANLHPGELLRAPLMLLGFVFAGSLLVSTYAAALSPPTFPDELAYHLPEAEVLVQNHHLPLTLGGHWFYGNLPKLGEVLYAEGISVAGNVSAGRVLQVTILAAFLCYVAGWLRECFSAGAALLAVCFLLYLDDLTQYAPTAYVDAASACFEVGSLLALARWIDRRQPEAAAEIALLLGLGLSVKYSPLPAALFILVVVAIVVVRAGERRRNVLRIAAAAAGITVLTAGFWYGKNLVKFGNPFYPLYLGHEGVPQADYTSLINAIQQFGPRTLHAFVRIPLRFASIAGLPLFLGFYTFPLAAFVRRARAAVVVLVAYVPLYTAYWFFLATHQTRFLASAEAVIVLLFAIVVTEVELLPVRALAAAIAVVAIAVGQPRVLPPSLHPSVLRAWVGPVLSNKLERPYWPYAIGDQSRESVLHRRFGCHYDAVEYARAHLRGAVIDNWTVWHDDSLFIYSQGTSFSNFASSPDANLWRTLKADDIHYVYLRLGAKDAARTETDPVEAAYYRARIGTENTILRRSNLIWQKDDCRIYRIRGV
jgi:hypothetical protein